MNTPYLSIRDLEAFPRDVARFNLKNNAFNTVSSLEYCWSRSISLIDIKYHLLQLIVITFFFVFRKSNSNFYKNICFFLFIFICVALCYISISN